MNWILFSDRSPPLVENGRGATDYARVLVTNNLEARDAFGSMSHLWIGRPREVDDSGNGIGKKQWSVAEGGQYLTHWCDPAAADESAKPVEHKMPSQLWQPIRTAPRNGTNILIRFGKDGVSQAKYVAGTPHPWKFIDTNDGVTWLVNHAHDGEDYADPSHWMPMPGDEYIGNDRAMPAPVASKEAVTLSDEQDGRRYRFLCEHPDWRYIEDICQRIIAKSAVEFYTALSAEIDKRMKMGGNRGKKRLPNGSLAFPAQRDASKTEEQS